MHRHQRVCVKVSTGNTLRMWVYSCGGIRMLAELQNESHWNHSCEEEGLRFHACMVLIPVCMKPTWFKFKGDTILWGHKSKYFNILHYRNWPSNEKLLQARGWVCRVLMIDFFFSSCRLNTRMLPAITEATRQIDTSPGGYIENNHCGRGLGNKAVQLQGEK